MQLGSISHMGRVYEPKPDEQHVVSALQLTSLASPRNQWGVLINLPVEMAASPVFIDEFQDLLAEMHQTAVLALEGK